MSFRSPPVFMLLNQQVQNLISQNDRRGNILVATQSANIAMDARKDSVAIKTIAGITMVFLPGTFVAVSLPPSTCHDCPRPNPMQSITDLLQHDILLPRKVLMAIQTSLLTPAGGCTLLSRS